MPKHNNALYKAQAELDHIWSSLFEAHVVLNDNLIHFFASPDHEVLYKQAYITAIADTNEKYQVVLTRSSFDNMLNNVFQSQSIQTYKPGFETLGWEDLYPAEMKAAREAAQKKQDREAKKEAKSAIKKWIEPPQIGEEIKFEHEIIDL